VLEGFHPGREARHRRVEQVPETGNHQVVVVDARLAPVRHGLGEDEREVDERDHEAHRDATDDGPAQRTPLAVQRELGDQADDDQGTGQRPVRVSRGDHQVAGRERDEGVERSARAAPQRCPEPRDEGGVEQGRRPRGRIEVKGHAGERHGHGRHQREPRRHTVLAREHVCPDAQYHQEQGLDQHGRDEEIGHDRHEHGIGQQHRVVDAEQRLSGEVASRPERGVEEREPTGSQLLAEQVPGREELGGAVVGEVEAPVRQHRKLRHRRHEDCGDERRERATTDHGASH